MLPVYTSEDIAALPADSRIRLGVIGNPIAHSKSPQMQQVALDAEARSCRYVRLLAGTGEGEFETLLQLLAERGFIGANVTVPFKKKAFAAAVQADALSTLCGAANTLVHRENGWHCFNTDGPGFERAITELCGKKLSELSIAILGAYGGAGSALCCQCALSGCRNLTAVNRPRPELEQLHRLLQPHAAGEWRTTTFDSPDFRQAVESADLIVNATSLGLHAGDPLPLEASRLHPGQIVYDIVTHATPLQAAAAEHGCTVSDGLGMLLWQGAIAYQHWFGSLPDTRLMRRALLQA
ncbi:MAG: shikimate dehydrogenase [Akkermansia sp.]|nr:shikimate dehydrogenase [Akkermansia sp.]